MTDKISIFLLGGTISNIGNKNHSNDYINLLIKQSRLIKPQSFIIKRLYENDSVELFNQPNILENIIEKIKNCKSNRILIIMGTDRMINMGKILLKIPELTNKLVLLMGAMIPYKNLIHTDSVFNFGFALGTINQNNLKGIFITMHGILFHPNDIYKDRLNKYFKYL
jgi:L-asparaginase